MPLHIHKVKIHMKSGAVITSWAYTLVKTSNGNDLTGLEWTGDLPFYVRLADISAIETKAHYNWRRLFL